MEISNNYNVNFEAKLGNKLKATLLKTEFGGNTQKLTEFEDSFHSTVKGWLDDNSVLELNKNGGFELKLPAFPSYKIGIKLQKKGNLPSRILDSHYINYNFAECSLFQKIISQEVSKGKTLDELSTIAQKGIANSDRRDYFDDYIRFAKRILKENPQSKLTDVEFLEMGNREMRELIEDPKNGFFGLF